MKKMKLNLLFMVIILLFGCGAKKDNFIVTENGKKQYKNEDGILVKNDWVEVNGDKYYFDLNGYMVTNDWIQNEYFVDKDGKMKKDYWYNDEKNPDVYYYLGKDGKYVKNDIVEIGKKKYAFDKKGNWIKSKTYMVEKPDKYVIVDANGIVVEKGGLCEVDGKEYYVQDDGYIMIDGWKDVDKKKSYFDNEGKRVYSGFGILEDNKSTESEIKKWCYIDENGDILKDDYVKVGDLYYCADKDGVLLCNEWNEFKGKKYYYGSDCYMLKNQLIDNMYYVDETGAMVVNKDVMIDGRTYTFGSDGKGNIKVIKKTSNAYWEIRNYSNTGEKYVNNKKYFIVGSSKIEVIADKDDLRLRLFSKSSGTLIKSTKKYVEIIISSALSDKDFKISSETIDWDNDGYIIFNNVQKNKIIDAMKNDSAILIGFISERNSNYDYNIYEISITAKGFSEIYSSLF